MEYTNLKNKLLEKRIDIGTVAECLGTNEKTIRNKIEGKSKIGFSFDEADKIKRFFLNEYDKDYLFARNLQSTA